MIIPQLEYPYLRITEIHRWICRDSVIIIYVLETGERLMSWVPFN